MAWNAYDEPEMQRLCTKQIQELSAMTARHAQDRIRLGLRLRDERAEAEDKEDPSAQD